MIRGIARNLAACLALLAAPCARAAPVGSDILPVAGPNGTPTTVAVWYPATAPGADTPVAGTRLPLVAIAHDQGGDPSDHAGLARTLAESGFVAVAPRFAGDRRGDLSRVLDIAGRDRSQIKLL